MQRRRKRRHLMRAEPACRRALHAASANRSLKSISERPQRSVVAPPARIFATNCQRSNCYLSNFPLHTERQEILTNRTLSASSNLHSNARETLPSSLREATFSTSFE